MQHTTVSILPASAAHVFSRRKGIILFSGILFIIAIIHQTSMILNLSREEWNSSTRLNDFNTLDEEVLMNSVYPSRGIIISLHDAIVPMGVSLIKELRCLGNHELIEVYHCFPDELSDASRALLVRNDPNVHIIDVCTEIMEQDDFLSEIIMRKFQGYWLKPLALYYTKLVDVILLDADVVLLQDPSILRTLSGYRNTGTIFFYDRIIPHKRFFNRIVTRRSGQKLRILQHILEKFEYTKFRIDTSMGPSKHLLTSKAYLGETCHEQDSSMVLIDKSRAGKAMKVLYFLMFFTRFEMNFSWGDKESFWLSYELAHQPYFFSPWGLALVNSVASNDLDKHPDTMCGSMAHYMPVSDQDEGWEEPQVLYINGKALLNPFPAGSIDKTMRTKQRSRLYNINPTHLSARYNRSEYMIEDPKQDMECVHNTGAVQLPDIFRQYLMRRRIHYLAVETQYYEALDQCQQY